MNEKPEALILADGLDVAARGIRGCLEVFSAAELRRLHAENEALTATRDRQAAMLRRLEEREAELDAEIGHLRRENERLREENRLWYSRAVALFWKADADNITAGRLQSAAKEIEAALRREETT